MAADLRTREERAAQAHQWPARGIRAQQMIEHPQAPARGRQPPRA
jgi:hypothetical protein